MSYNLCRFANREVVAESPDAIGAAAKTDVLSDMQFGELQVE